MIEIRKIEAEDTYAIRKEELRKNVSLSHKMNGDVDAHTLHLGLYSDGELAGIGSFMRSSLPDFREKMQYQLRGMATRTPDQGRGFGRLLLAEAEKRLKERGVELLWCNARVIALDFYLKMGYQVQGESFELPEIGSHYKMFKKL